MNQRKRIIEVGLKLAEQKGFYNVTNKDIARKLYMSPANIGYHIGSKQEIEDAIVSTAITEKSWMVVAQALSVGHRVALRISEKDRKKASRALLSIELEVYQ